MSRKGFLLFLIAGFAWGVPYFFIRIAVQDFSAPTIIFARVVVGAAVLIPLALKQGALLTALKAWRWVLAFAALEMVGPWWLITTAEQHISSGLTGLLIATVPFFGVLIAYFFMGDKTVFHPKTVLGLVIGFAGVILLVGIDSIGGQVDPLWVGAVVVASIGYALAPAIASAKISHVPTVGVIALSMAMVAVVYAVPALLALPAEIAAEPSINSWIALAVLGVVCSAIAFVVFFELMKEIGAARATLITHMNTLVAILLGTIFLAEPLTAGILLGVPLVLVGSWFAARTHA